MLSVWEKKKAAVICVLTAQKTEQRADHYAAQIYGHPIQLLTWDINRKTVIKLL